jgi:hypothetical protein
LSSQQAAGSILPLRIAEIADCSIGPSPTNTIPLMIEEPVID